MAISLTLRGTKGSALTHNELDGNFTSIKTSVESDYVTTSTAQSISGAKTFANTLTMTSTLIPRDVQETVYNWGNASGSHTINVTSGTIHRMTLVGNLTVTGFTTPLAGQSATLVIKQDSTGSRTLTTATGMLFVGGSKTLTTSSNATDVVNMFYDGTNYLCSLTKGFV